MTGTEPRLSVRLQDGVRVLGGQHVLDEATRRTVPLPAGADVTDVTDVLLRRRLAYVTVGPPEAAALLLRAARRRQPALCRSLTLGFRRRWPRPGLLPEVVAVSRAAVLPAALSAAMILGCAGVVGVLVGAPAVALGAAGTGAAVVVASLVAHESAHLVVLRLLGGDRGAGAVAHSWLDVWVVGPDLPDRVRRLTAVAGPAVGAGACLGAAALGAAGWVCALVGVVHVANLLPAAPDGRSLFLGRAPG